jgi:hypothetical protein
MTPAQWIDYARRQVWEAGLTGLMTLGDAFRAWLELCEMETKLECNQ